MVTKLCLLSRSEFCHWRHFRYTYEYVLYPVNITVSDCRHFAAELLCV